MNFKFKKYKEEYNYFNEFEKNASCSMECAKIINEILNNYNQKELIKRLEEVHNIEHQADEGKHNMTSFLIKDFLPPIEREDIVTLSQEIDDLTDNIEEILINIDMFNIIKMREEISIFTKLLVECCNNEQILLKEFKNFKKNTKIQEKVIEMNRLEEEGDVLYIETMRKLYRDGTSAIDIMKWTKIYNCFEKSFDICETIANDIESIVLKNL